MFSCLFRVGLVTLGMSAFMIGAFSFIFSGLELGRVTGFYGLGIAFGIFGQYVACERRSL